MCYILFPYNYLKRTSLLVCPCLHSSCSTLTPGELCAVSPSSAVAPLTLDDNEALPDEWISPQNVTFTLQPLTFFLPFLLPSSCHRDAVWNAMHSGNKYFSLARYRRVSCLFSAWLLVLSMLLCAATCVLSCCTFTGLTFLSYLLFVPSSRAWKSGLLFARTHTSKHTHKVNLDSLNRQMLKGNGTWNKRHLSLKESAIFLQAGDGHTINWHKFLI